jgi:hypothetical protein
VRDALWLADTTTPIWARELPEHNALYIKLNEIAQPPEVWLADAMRNYLAHAANQHFDRVIIDIRHNHGGSGGFNFGVINAVTDSPYNARGNLYVLMGRETFSAAQMLLNEFEKYTDALFVGEGSGSSPAQFGDPRRVQLSHSGLTLRVSQLYWSSWRAFESRRSTQPHISVNYAAADYLAGRDPALAAALNHSAPDTLARSVGAVLADGLNWDGARIMLLRHLTDHRVQDHDLRALGEDLLGVASEYEFASMPIVALYLYDLSRTYLSADPRPYLGWSRAALAAGEAEEAISALEQGLRAIPGDAELAAALAQANAATN